MKNISTFINEQLTNHLTPMTNVVMTIKNLYGQELGIIVDYNEEEKTIYLKSSNFRDKLTVSLIIDKYMYNGMSLRQYIYSVGLDNIEILPVNGEQTEWFVKCTAFDLHGDTTTHNLAKLLGWK